MPPTYPSPFIIPGKHRVVGGQNVADWQLPATSGMSEWIDDFVYTRLADIMDIREKSGVPSGMNDREILTHHGDLNLTLPWRHNGLATYALAAMFGAGASGASDSQVLVGAGPQYSHPLKLGTLGNRLNTMSIWEYMGGTDASPISLYRACTPKSFKLTWEAKVLLSVEVLMESLHPVTADDTMSYVAPPSGVNLSYIGTAGMSQQVSRTRTRGLETYYQIIGSNGTAYNTIFHGGDLTMVRALESVFGKSGGSYGGWPSATPTLTTAAPTAGAGPAAGVYKYAVAFYNANGIGPLSAPVTGTSTGTAMLLSGLNLAATWAASNATGIAIYRSLVGATTPLYFVGVSAGLATQNDNVSAIPNIAYPNPLAIGIDPLNPVDMQPGDLEMTGSFQILFEGSTSGSAYRDFLDFKALGANGGSTMQRLYWKDRDGNILELDFYPIYFDTMVIDRSAQGVKATVNFTATNDPGQIGGATPALSIVSANLTNLISTTLIN